MTEKQQTPINASDAAAIIAATEAMATRQGRIVDIGGDRKAAVLLEGESLVSIKEELDTYLTKPERLDHVTRMHDLPSFMNELDRFKSPALTVYVSATDPTRNPDIVAVFNDSLPGAPDFRDHRALYSPNPSNEIRSWLAAGEKAVSQEVFAELIEERFGDICKPIGDDPNMLPLLEAATGLALDVGTPAQLLEVSRGLQLNVGQTVKGKPNLHNGAVSFTFDESVQPTVTVPGAVVLDVPFFEGAPTAMLLARIRYKLVHGSITWRVLIHDLPRAYRESVENLCTEIRAAGHRVVLGQP